MVDTYVSGAYGAIRAGSSPAFGTIKQTMTFCYRLFYCSYGNDAKPLNEVHSGSADFA